MVNVVFIRAAFNAGNFLSCQTSLESFYPEVFISLGRWMVVVFWIRVKVVIVFSNNFFLLFRSWKNIFLWILQIWSNLDWTHPSHHHWQFLFLLIWLIMQPAMAFLSKFNSNLEILIFVKKIFEKSLFLFSCQKFRIRIQVNTQRGNWFKLCRQTSEEWKADQLRIVELKELLRPLIEFLWYQEE